MYVSHNVRRHRAVVFHTATERLAWRVQFVAIRPLECHSKLAPYTSSMLWPIVSDGVCHFTHTNTHANICTHARVGRRRSKTLSRQLVQ